MRLHAVRTFSLLLVTTILGCGSGDTPTPVPSNTPIDSPQDVDPRSDGDQEHDKATDDASESNANATAVNPAPPDESAARENPRSAGDADPATPTAPAASPLEAKLAALEPAELIERLADDQQRDAVTRVLVAKGSASLEALKSALESGDWQVRAAAVFTLGQLGDAAAPSRDKLKQIAEQDDHPAVRDAAAFALDALKP